MLEIKRIGPEDAEALSALWIATFKRAYAELHAPEDLEAYCVGHCSVEKAHEMLESAAVICKIAARDGAAVGYSTVRNAPCPVELKGASAELKQLYILPEEFGAGLGRALMDDALATMGALGAAHAWLAVADINRRGPPFYRKFGFDFVGVGPTFQVGKDVVPSKLMARAISSTLVSD